MHDLLNGLSQGLHQKLVVNGHGASSAVIEGFGDYSEQMPVSIEESRELAEVVTMGWKGKAANRHYGGLGKKIGVALGWTPLPRQYVYELVTFDRPEKQWLWILRPEVAAAIEQLGLAGESASLLPEEATLTEPLCEKAVRTIVVNAYERNAEAREKCLLHYGCKCAVCGVVLAEVYGEIAQGFIHVHHLKPLGEIGAKYRIDPIKDLRPICPTCHSIIHLRKPAYSIEEVKALLANS